MNGQDQPAAILAGAVLAVVAGTGCVGGPLRPAAEPDERVAVEYVRALGRNDLAGALGMSADAGLQTLGAALAALPGSLEALDALDGAVAEHLGQAAAVELRRAQPCVDWHALRPLDWLQTGTDDRELGIRSLEREDTRSVVWVEWDGWFERKARRVDLEFDGVAFAVRGHEPVKRLNDLAEARGFPGERFAAAVLILGLYEPRLRELAAAVSAGELTTVAELQDELRALGG